MFGPDNKYLFELDNYQQLHNLECKEFSIQNEYAYFTIKYSVDDNKFWSGRNATFGIVKISKGFDVSCNADLFDNFYSFLRKNFCGYEIKLPPNYCEPAVHSVFAQYFGKKDVKLVFEENQYIDLQTLTYGNGFSKTNRKIARRLANRGYTVKFQKDLSQSGFEVLEKNRASRNVILSLSFEDLRKQSKVLREHFHFVSCYSASKDLVAYSVCVRLREDILYVLYWGEDPNYRSESPIVMLCQELIQYAKNIGCKYLDLGISSIDGEVDLNLYCFKKRLGSISCSKLVILE